MSETSRSQNRVSNRAPKRDLTQGEIGRHLVKMTVPMVWGILAVIGFQLVDIWYISLLGTQKLAAVTFTFPVTYFVFAVTMGLGIATSSVLARQIGQGDQHRVKRLTTHALIMAGSLGLFFSLIGLTGGGPLFALMGADKEMLPLISHYMTIWFFGAAFVTLPIVGNSAIRAGGDTMTPAKIMMMATLVNILLDPLLIFGWLGFPRMELQGAALATVFANLAAAVAGLYVLKFKKDMIVGSARHIKLLGDSLRRFMVIAIPAGLMQALQPIANAVIIALLAGESAAAVAAFGITSRIEAFVMVVVMALSVGMGPILGQNWGARQYDRVHETLHKAFRFIVLWSLFMAVLLALLARPLIGLFSQEQEVVQLAALYFWIVPITAVLGNLVHSWTSALNALGQSRRALALMFLKMIGLMVPLALLGDHFWGVPGVFAGVALTNVIAGGLFHFINWNAVKRAES